MRLSTRGPFLIPPRRTCRHRRHQPLDLVLRREVVDGGADELGQAAGVHVPAGAAGAGDGDVDPLRSQPRLDLAGGDAVDGEGGDAPFDGTEVVEGDTGDRAQPRSQQGGGRLDPGPDRVEAEVERVVDRDTQAELAGDVALPILEAAGIGAQRVAGRAGPLRGVEIDKGWCQALDQGTADIEEADATRTPQELAAGGGEDIAAHRLDIERHLTRRLAGIE